MNNNSVMFPILLGRLERSSREEEDEKIREQKIKEEKESTWLADRRELIDMLNSEPILRNDGELAVIARILHVRGGEAEEVQELRSDAA